MGKINLENMNNIPLTNYTYAINPLYGRRPVPVYEGWILPLSAFVGLTFPFFIPQYISILIKPATICFAFLWQISHSMRIRIHSTQIWLLLFAALYSIAVLRTPTGGDVVSGIGYIIYIIYALCLTTIQYTDKTIKRFIWLLFLSGLCFATVTAISNPFFGTSIRTRAHLNMFSFVMNSNQISYVVAIGLCASLLLIYSKGKFNKFWPLYFPCILVMLYVMFLTMSRGAFLGILGAYSLFACQLLKEHIKRGKFLYLWGIIIISISIGYLIWVYLPDSVYERLLSTESYQNTNGRGEMYHLTISIIDNWFFGEGNDCWNAFGMLHGKIHNIFLNVLVETGITGLLTMLLVLISVFRKIKNFAPLYLLAPMMMQAMVESGDAYTFWVPFIVSTIIVYSTLDKTKQAKIRMNA